MIRVAAVLAAVVTAFYSGRMACPWCNDCRRLVGNANRERDAFRESAITAHTWAADHRCTP